MSTLTCPGCGATIVVPEEQITCRCRGCGLMIDTRRLAEGQAVDHLLKSVEKSSDLPGKLRFKISRLLREHLAELDDAALVTSVTTPPEPVTPPPLPRPAPKKLADGAEDLIGAPPAPPTLPVTPAEPTEPAEPTVSSAPSLWARLGPAFTENILFTLAAFLLVAGAVYFVTTAWTTMTGEQRLLVVVGGLELLGGVLYLAGRLLNRGGSLPEVERVLTIVVCFMVPVAAAAAGELLAVSLVLGIVASLTVLGPGYLVARDLSRVSEPAFRPVLPLALIGLSGLTLLAPTGEGAPTLATFAGGLALLLGCRAHFRSLMPRLGPGLAPALWSTLILTFAAIVFTAVVSLAAWRHGLPAGRTLPPLGIMLAAISVVAVMLEGSLSRAKRLAGDRSPTLLVSALCLALTGVAIALAYEQALLAAALLGAGGALVAGYRLPVPALLLPGLLLAGLAYLKLPAPVREFALMVRDEAADALGYQPERLPFAYYGVTCLPFVALCGFAGAILTRIGQTARAQVVLWWTLVVAGGLCVQAMLLCRGDLRAPAAVFLAEGAMLLVLARFVKNRFFVGGGIALIYGGLSFWLHRLEATTAVHVLAMSVTGLAVLTIARRLRVEATDYRTAAADTLTDLTAFMAVALIAAIGLGHLANISGGDNIFFVHEAGALDVPAALIFGFLLSLVGGIYRRPEGALLAILIFARGLTGAMNATGIEPWGIWRVLVFGVGSAVPLLIYRMMPRIPERRKLFPELDPMLCVPVGILILQAFGAVEVGDAQIYERLSFAHAGGLLAGAAVLILTAIISGQGWVSMGAVIQVFVAGPVLAGALGFKMPRAAAALAAAVGVAVIRGGAFLAESRERTQKLLTPFLTGSIAPLAGIILFWLVTLLTQPDYRHTTGYDGTHLAVAALIAVLAARLTNRTESLLLAGLLLPLVPIGILDQFTARVDLYPLALLLSAGVASVWSNHLKVSLATTMIHLALAFVVATVLAFGDLGSTGILFLTFLMTAGAGWMIARTVPVPGSLMMLFSALIGIPLVFLHRGMNLELRWQPFVLLIFATATLLAPRIRALNLHRTVCRVFASPFLGIAVLVFTLNAAWVLRTEPSTRHLWHESPTAIILAAAAFVAGVTVFAREFKNLARQLFPAFALLLFFFVCAPVNILIEGNYSHFWRPDVETALVGVLLALLLPGKAKRGGLTPYIFAGIAVLLTVGDLRHLSTPLAVFGATLAALVLLIRTGWRLHADLLSNGLIATAFAFVLYAVPESGRPMPEILVVLSLTAAAVLVGLLFAARWLRNQTAREWSDVAAERFTRAAATAGLLSILCVLANLFFLSDRPAETDLVLMTAAAMLTVAGVSLRGALTLEKPHLVHVATGALLVLYAFLAMRTGALDLLEDYHLHVLAVLSAGVLSLSVNRLRTPLTLQGLLLPIPVVLTSFLALAGIEGPASRAASGFFLAGTAYGLAAHRLGRTALWGVAGVLLNLAIFSIWRHRGIVDPAFYGVPAGLSFLISAEMLRRRVSRTAHLQMFVLGAALLYGSVGIQVLRVEQPTHALILFALGILTVVLGFLRNRNDFLVAGTSVVVLDVIAYLARHGFEEGFLGAALLILAGLTVLTVATLSTLRRRRREDRANDRPNP